MSQEKHDVVIVGGGLVGGLTALLLAKENIDVVVLDSAPLLDSTQVLEKMNSRVLALSQATIHLLQIAGVWPHIERYEPYTAMHVWNKNGYGDIHFGHESIDKPAETDWLGVMVEPSILNLAMQKTMLEKVKHYRTNVRVKHLEQCTDSWSITLANDECLNTKLVIGADGANSFVRQEALIGLKVLDYKQSAIGCAIQTNQPHHHVARQIFLPTGPLAYLPIKSPVSKEDGYWQSIVWTLPTNICNEYMALDEIAFADRLTKESLYMLGGVKIAKNRSCFPLKARAAEKYVMTGLALVGDAAHVIHPLAGQGVNIGCLDAAMLCDVLLTDIQRGAWANIQTLRKYEYLRRHQNEAMMHSMSILGWLESSQVYPLIWARSFGHKIAMSNSKLKDFFMYKANGLESLRNTRYAK
ncbi:FAD-dependent monooxygenase [Acinetobacter nectaris]|uniref:FAD-dependent monooxygenase n=1 Tax=Acinetobacter nectaris TaxID=1219382 RepID=UPI001F00DCE4|nr:FAD-dependent monooxygenase [Acinetobacter nectaris]MCF8998827.1 FAD-dependent monooxygenase [Acinetobacter nectaris]MCF9027932.1 FAD-dependent monooxygenase [Acinetobacter nectaris]